VQAQVQALVQEMALAKVQALGKDQALAPVRALVKALAQAQDPVSPAKR
jgi:hypothetical protein